MEAGELPPFFGLTNAELPMMFGVLKRVDAFMAALYTDQADEPPDENILDVRICKMRSRSPSASIQDALGANIAEARKAIAREFMGAGAPVAV
jgi:hypothetical protein